LGYEEQLDQLKRGLQQALRLRADAETKHSFYLEQRERILQKIKELGVEPEELDKEISRLQREMDRLLKEAEKLIPWDLLKQQEGQGRG